MNHKTHHIYIFKNITHLTSRKKTHKPTSSKSVGVRRGVVRGRSINLVIDLLSNKIDAKGYKSDAEARSGVAELVGEHGMLPPFVSSPEELSC